jgi:hypothetical protein
MPTKAKMTMLTSDLHVVPDDDIAETDNRYASRCESPVTSVGFRIQQSDPHFEVSVLSPRRYEKNQSRRSERPGVSERWRGGRWRRLACCVVSLSALPVQAERADRDKPVNLEADRVNVDARKQTAVLRAT